LPELFASAWHAFSERKQGQTVADYYGKLVGRQNWKHVFKPLFATVLSQPADNFPAEILFKKRPRRKDIPRSFTFAGGIQTLADRIAAQPRITVRTNAEVRGLARTGGSFVVELAGGDRVFAQRLALALPAPESARLLAPLAPDIATALAGIQTAKIESVGVVAEARHVHLPRLAGIVPIGDTFFSVVTRDVVPTNTCAPLPSTSALVCRSTSASTASAPSLAWAAASLHVSPRTRRLFHRWHWDTRQLLRRSTVTCQPVASTSPATTSAAWPSKTARCARPRRPSDSSPKRSASHYFE